MTTAKVRFLQNNQAAADGATVTVSSAVSGFAGSNSVDTRRWKKWRAQGAFYIGSTNNTIYINDGSNKTVTLTTGWYTSGAALAAHVQTQLNASSTNWTCTYSTTTGKFTTGRSSGTATARLTQTTNAAWDTLGYTGAADVSFGTGTASDERRNHTSECWTVDLGVAKDISALIAITTAGATFPFSSAGTYTLKASATNNATTPWGASYDAVYSPTQSDDGLHAFFTTATYRYWQLEMIDRTNTGGPTFDLAVIYLGDYVEPTTYDLNLGFERVLVDPSVRNEAESGALFHRRMTKYWSYRALTVGLVSDTDRTELERVADELGRTTPFFVSLDPDAAISSEVAEFTKYVVFDDDMSRAHQLWKYYGLSFNLREVI